MRRGQRPHRCVRCLTFLLSKDSLLSVMRLMVPHEHSPLDDLLKCSISWTAMASCPQNRSGHCVMGLLSFLFVIHFYPALVFMCRQLGNSFLIQMPLLERFDVFIPSIWCCGLVLLPDSESTMCPPAGECVKYHEKYKREKCTSYMCWGICDQDIIQEDAETLVHGKKVLWCGPCFTALWGMHWPPGILFPIKNFPVLSVKAM